MDRGDVLDSVNPKYSFKIIIGGACRAGTFAPLDKIGGLCVLS